MGVVEFKRKEPDVLAAALAARGNPRTRWLLEHLEEPAEIVEAYLAAKRDPRTAWLFS